MAGIDDNDIARELSGLSTSILADARGGRGAVAPGLIRFSGKGTVAGRAVTADCAEGSLQAVFAALEQAGPGDMLCTVGPGNSAYLGDLLATNIMRRGLVGAVIDGYVRDRETISAMPLTFMARGLTPVNQRRQDPGSPMVPVTIGGIVIAPGDWVVADDDGVLVIAPGEVEAALAKAQVNARIEERIKELVERGAKVTDAVRQAVAEVTGSAKS
jgi:regulator of RNase E activity RraA